MLTELTDAQVRALQATALRDPAEARDPEALDPVLLPEVPAEALVPVLNRFRRVERDMTDRVGGAYATWRGLQRDAAEAEAVYDVACQRLRQVREALTALDALTVPAPAPVAP